MLNFVFEMMRIPLLILLYFFASALPAQLPDSIYYAGHPDSAAHPFTYNLEPVVFVEQKRYYGRENRREFLITRFCVQRVYPLAIEALELMRETDSLLAANDKKRIRKRMLRKNYRKLKAQYKEVFKNMYVEEGRIMIKILERETGLPFYQIIKKYRSSIDAEFWNKMARFQGYSLKEGYDPEKEAMLESILEAYEEEHFIHHPGR